ncbi:MAG: hypothetical protein ACLFQX_08255 [Candidatus Kapaibacterium sp.]
MRQYKVISAIRAKGRLYKPGELVKLTDKAAGYAADAVAYHPEVEVDKSGDRQQKDIKPNKSKE